MVIREGEDSSGVAGREVWLVTHPEIRRRARVGFVFDALVTLFHTEGQSLRPVLRPEAAG